MTIKTISTIAMLSAALSGPVFAQQTGVNGTADDHPAHSLRQHYRGVYNQAPVNQPLVPQVRDSWGAESHGRDPSRIGDEDPYLHPSGS